MVDSRILEQGLDFADSKTNFSGSSRVSNHNRETLASCDDRLYKQKMLAIQALRNTGRMVDLRLLKENWG